MVVAYGPTSHPQSLARQILLLVTQGQLAGSNGMLFNVAGEKDMVIKRLKRKSGPQWARCLWFELILHQVLYVDPESDGTDDFACGRVGDRK